MLAYVSSKLSLDRSSVDILVGPGSVDKYAGMGGTSQMQSSCPVDSFLSTEYSVTDECVANL